MPQKKLFLITSSFPFGAGESTFVMPELRELKESFEVTVVSCGSGEMTSQLPDGVRLVRYHRGRLSRALGLVPTAIRPGFWREITKAGKAGGLSAMKASAVFLSDARHFGGFLARLGKGSGMPDCVYSFWRKSPLYGALLYKKQLGDPVVVTRAHGFDLYRERYPGGYPPFSSEIDELIDRVYLVSRAGYDYYLSNYSHCEPPKCELSYLGADNDVLSPDVPDDALRIYSCSNLWDIKRIDYIIEALALIKNRPVRWTHFGDGPLEKELKALAASKLGGKPDCEYDFAGYVPNKRLREIVAERPFDCFVTASMSEGVPISIVEAASFGIPAVATDAGGIRDIVNEQTGILLPVDCTVSQLADALDSIKRQTPEKRAAMRKAAFDGWRERFVASKNARLFRDRLLRLCEEREDG